MSAADRVEVLARLVYTEAIAELRARGTGGMDFPAAGERDVAVELVGEWDAIAESVRDYTRAVAARMIAAGVQAPA